MPQVKVQREIKGKKKDVYSAVKEYLQGRGTLTKLGATITWNDKTCGASLEGGSFSGAIEVSDTGSVSTVSIKVDLPLLLTPFKGKVEEELNKHLDRVKV